MKKKAVLFLFIILTFSFSKITINNKPFANDQTVTVTEQSSYVINLVASDSDGDELTYSIVDMPSSGTAVLDGRSVTYTSNSDTAISDVFTFKVNDGVLDSSKATINIIITPVNDPPTADSQNNVDAIENTEKPITLTGFDLEGENLSFILETAPVNGRLLDPANGNKTIFNGTLSSNQVIYLSTSDNATSDSFVFKSYDGFSVSENATVSIDIQQINDPPIAIGEDIVLTEEVPTNITLTARDPDGTVPSIFKINSLTNGNLTDPGNGDSVVTAGTVLSGNVVTFTSRNLANSDSFTFSANDGFLESQESTISINIITDAPTATPQEVSATEQIDKKIILSGTDKEGDNLTYIISTLPTIGILKENDVIITANQLPKTTTNTNLFYNSNSNTAIIDDFKFKVNDGKSNSSAAKISITISPVNDKPVAIAQNVVVTEQTLFPITLNGSDLDGDELTYSIVDMPANGNAVLVGNKLNYTSTSDTAISDSFTFKVNDSKLDSSKATVSIVITPINDYPVPISQTLTTIEDTKLEIVLSADDPDDNNLTYLIEGAPVNGTTTLVDNKVTYTPDLGYYGNDAFIFRAKDAKTFGTAGYVEISITSNDFDNDGILNDFDKCPNTPLGSKVDVEGCVVFELPMNNNKVEVVNTSCIGTMDGSIEVSIEDNSYNYNVTLTDANNKVLFYLINGTNKKGSFNNLPKGTYDVCFKVDGKANYEQCFSVFVGNPNPLSAFVDFNNDDKTTNIQLSGSNLYNIEVNGTLHKIYENKFMASLNTGLNIIKISTDLVCQGSIEKEIFISEKILYYPNPTRGEVGIYVNGEDSSILISIFNTNGELIYSKNHKLSKTRKTKLDLSDFPSGTYIIRLKNPSVKQTFKIIKN